VKGGGFTAPLFPITISDLNTLEFRPEKLSSYEAGIKTEFLNHTLRVNAAAYHYDVKNVDARHRCEGRLCPAQCSALERECPCPLHCADGPSVNGLAQLYPGNPRWWKAHVIYHF
jgi:hypothetical protein